MDSLEVNKALAAILVAGVAWMGATLIADGVVHPTLLEKTAIKIEGVPAAGESQAPKQEQEPPVALLLQTASAKTGEADAQKFCSTCHNFKEGAGPKIGPDLYGVVGRPVASKQGFDYSAALKKHSGPWTYAELFEWLKKPSAYAPGTKMTFAGIDSEKQRANVIAWLRTLSPKPEPLPAVPAAPAQGNATQGNAAQGNAAQKGSAGGATQPSSATAPAAVTPEGPQSGALLNAPQTKATQGNMPPIEHIVPGSPSGTTANAPAPAANTMPTTAGSGQGNNTTQPAK